MKNVSKTTTNEKTCTHHKAAEGSPLSSVNKAAVASKGDEDDHNDDDADLLLAIAKACAKEGSISATPAADSATTKMCSDGDDGLTTMKEEATNTINADSKMGRGSVGQPHKNDTSYADKNQELNPPISAPEEEFDIMDVVRERQQTTDSSYLGIRHQKEMEKQKKNASEIFTSSSYSNINPTNKVGGGADVLGDGIQMKKTDNEQQHHERTEEFDVMDVVVKRAALINNEESNGSSVVPEPPQSIERQRPVIPVVSQPGAYSGAPGERLQRRDTFRFSLVGVLGALGWSRAVLEDRTTAEEDIGIAERTNHNEPILTNTDQIGGLAEATPVDDDDFIAPDVEAQPFEVDEAEKKKSTSERTYKAKLGLMAILITAVVATVLGFVLKNRQEEHHSALAPSLAPSDAPSDTPSSAPTGSLDSLRVFPQSKRE